VIVARALSRTNGAHAAIATVAPRLLFTNCAEKFAALENHSRRAFAVRRSIE